MEQPILPEIKPYVNRGLFSDHFLGELLPKADSWQVDEDDVRPARQAALNLYAPREDELPQRNEAQLEREFVRPLLEALGHHFEVQPSLPTSEGVRRPDYAFFATEEDKGAALRKHGGEMDYFKRAIAVGDAKQWGRPLDKRQRVGADRFDMLSPSWQIDHYLRMSEVPWGILTDGRFWRLYSRDTSFRLDVHYQIDLPQLLAQPDIEAFKYFYLFFRRQAFVPDAEGLCFLDRVYQGSLEYAREVGDDLKENVYKALRLVAEGFLETRGNDLDPVADLEVIHENSLVFLYRLLFINYAEDRRLLPRDTRLYRETYGLVSMEGEIASKLERREALSPLQATYWERLDALFDLINRGSEAFGIEQDTLLVPPYNGGLFDPARHPFLERNKVADRWLAPVIDLLARSKGEGAGRAFVDYSSLDVRHLGSIYEGLLEYKLRVAQEERVAVKRRRREEWVPADEAEGKRIVERVKAGGLYLATDRGERKATGSYYTPDYIVKYIVENTVGPLIEEKMKEDDAIDGILSLKVLDPAMGSGHFLVEATDRLAHALVEALGGSEEEPEEADVRWARREVVERCLYGVDLNPLAVELAKLSLWLHTVAEGKPLNFLDHHLKVGNSLIGAWVDDLGSLPAAGKKAKGKEAEIDARQMNLFEIRFNERLPVMLGKVLEIIGRGSETLDDIKAKAAADEAIEELKAPFKAVANLWVSTYFGNEVTAPEYQEALEHIGETRQLLALGSVGRAREIAIDRHFFHWELEFPEVFYAGSRRLKNAGFDAVVGNPPYISVTKIRATERSYYLKAFDTAQGRFDVYILFIEQSLALLRRGGLHSFINPVKFCIYSHAYKLRELLLREVSLKGLVDISQCADVFEEPSTYPCILIVQRAAPTAEAKLLIAKPKIDSAEVFLGRLKMATLRETAIPVESFLERPEMIISPSLSVDALKMLSRFEQIGTALSEYYSVEQCIRIGSATKRRRLIVSDRDRVAASQEDKCYPVLDGENLQRYEILWDGSYLLYLPDELYNPKTPRLLNSEKLMIKRVAERLSVAFDDQSTGQPYYPLNTVYALAPTSDRCPENLYLLGLLNSRLFDWMYKVQFEAISVRGGYVEFREHLKYLHIRDIHFTTTVDRRASIVADLVEAYRAGDHGRVMELVEASLGSGVTDSAHDLLTHLARQMIDMNKEKRAEAKGFVDWLVGYTGVPIEQWRLKTYVKDYWKHPWEELQRALRQNRKPIEKASGRNVEGREAQEAIRKELEQSLARLKPLLDSIASTDRLIDLIVYRLYGLTEEEVAIVEESLAN